MNLPQPSRIDWMRAYLEANTMNESFQDVHIITLKSDIATIASVEAINSLSLDEILSISDEALDEIAKQFVAEGRISSCEYVNVDGDFIEVCIDADTTENEDTLARALDMVAEALDQLNGNEGVVHFGEPKSYTLADITWIPVSSVIS